MGRSGQKVGAALGVAQVGGVKTKNLFKKHFELKFSILFDFRIDLKSEVPQKVFADWRRKNWRPPWICCSKWANGTQGEEVLYFLTA